MMPKGNTVTKPKADWIIRLPILRNPAWEHTLRIQDVFHADELTLAERRDEIVRRIRRGKFWDAEDDELVGIVDELAELDLHDNDGQAEDEFNAVWDLFYDWADAHHVWVKIF